MRLRRSILFAPIFVAIAACGVVAKPAAAQSHDSEPHVRRSDLMPSTGSAKNHPQWGEPEIYARWIVAPLEPKIVAPRVKTANPDSFGGWMHWMSSLSSRGFDPRAWQPGKGFNPFNPATWFSFRPATPATAIQAGAAGGMGVRP